MFYQVEFIAEEVVTKRLCKGYCHIESNTTLSTEIFFQKVSDKLAITFPNHKLIRLADIKEIHKKQANLETIALKPTQR